MFKSPKNCERKFLKVLKKSLFLDRRPTVEYQEYEKISDMPDYKNKQQIEKYAQLA